MSFEDQTLYIHAEKRKLTVGFKDPATGSESNKPCFTMKLPLDFFSDLHDSYIFIAGHGGRSIANEHLIHGIRFRDTLHLHDEEEVDSAADKVAFAGKPKDVLR